MFGVIYLAASDFSTFSFPLSQSDSSACFECHKTEIEERYCLKQHTRELDDAEWENFLAHKIASFSDCESELFSPTETDCGSISTTSTGYFDDLTSVSASIANEHDYSSDSDEAEIIVLSEGECKNVTSAIKQWASSSLATSDERLVIEHPSKSCISYTKEISNGKRMIRNNPNQAFKKRPRKKYRNNSRSDTSSSISSLKRNALKRTQSNNSSVKSSDTNDIDNSNPWKCPHCPWVQHTQRLPDFLRHQRSHFISWTDWPCPDPDCGKSFARKDSLKRHLNNRSTPCERPPGYTIC